MAAHRHGPPQQGPCGLLDITLLIFLLAYVATSVGTLPGFKVDRSGAAVVSAMAIIAFSLISPPKAWGAIDDRSVGMLFGLMVVSAAFVVSRFYGKVAAWVTTLQVSPPVLLAILVIVSGLMSAILTNDVMVVAMTPLLVSITLAHGLNPVPFRLAFRFAANTGFSRSLVVFGSLAGIFVLEQAAALGVKISFAEFSRSGVAAAIACMALAAGWNWRLAD